MVVLGREETKTFYRLSTRLSQIAFVFQKIIFESFTLFHIMPFVKIIGPVEQNRTKSEFSQIFS